MGAGGTFQPSGTDGQESGGWGGHAMAAEAGGPDIVFFI